MVIPFGMLKRKLPGRIILYGHLVSDRKNLTAGKYRYPTMHEFSKMVAWWRGMGYRFVGLPEYMSEDGQRKILLTFDDGFKVLYQELRHYLTEERIPWMVFILTDPLHDRAFAQQLLGPGANPDAAEVFLSIEEIQELKKSGTHIGFHTRSHIRIDGAAVDDPGLLEQLTVPEEYKSLLSDPYCFAYPYHAPLNYSKFDEVLRRLGFVWIFDTRGFAFPDGQHFFRVSIDGDAKVSRHDWLQWTIKRQLLQHTLTQLKSS